MGHQPDVLPGGYWDAQGTLHRQFELAPLSGGEEELLAGSTAPPAVLVTAVLSRCVRRIGSLGPVTEEIARGLLVADRQYLMLRLREATFGESVAATLPCPWQGCRAKVDIDFSTRSIPVTESIGKGPWYEMELSPEAGFRDGEGNTHRLVTFRLPDGGDQEAIAPLVRSNEALALRVLLGRCIGGIGPVRNTDGELCDRLTPCARKEIEQAMERIAPKVESALSASCPECGRQFSAPFDLQDFFFGELRTSRDLLYREVHYLAFHYHWSEREIMAMPREKRRAYIDVLTDEIERLNNAV